MVDITPKLRQLLNVLGARTSSREPAPAPLRLVEDTPEIRPVPTPRAKSGKLPRSICTTLKDLGEF
jgi:hypothetical protein